MSIFDDIKSSLRSLVGKKTDMVIEESKAKIEEEIPSTPVVEAPIVVTTPVVEVHEIVQAPHDTPVDNVIVAVEQATKDLENIHTENQ